jgi:hypothetical protein
MRVSYNLDLIYSGVYIILQGGQFYLQAINCFAGANGRYMGVPVRQVPGDWVYWGYGSKMAGSDYIMLSHNILFSHKKFFPTAQKVIDKHGKNIFLGSKNQKIEVGGG